MAKIQTYTQVASLPSGFLTLIWKMPLVWACQFRAVKLEGTRWETREGSSHPSPVASGAPPPSRVELGDKRTRLIWSCFSSAEALENALSRSWEG